jgi:hypothetical protein
LRRRAGTPKQSLLALLVQNCICFTSIQVQILTTHCGCLRRRAGNLSKACTPPTRLSKPYTPLTRLSTPYTPLTRLLHLKKSAGSPRHRSSSSEPGTHLLYWYKSTCLLVQKYLLTGTEVQRLTTAESLSSFKTVEDQKSSLARQLKEKTQELDEVKEKSMELVCWRMPTYADVCRRMLTYADVC